jgi:hypothetical protein
MLTVIPYHVATTRHFREKQSVWNFFSNVIHKTEQLQQFKTDLLKNTYKFDADGHQQLFDMVARAKEKLQLDITVHLYQAQYTEEVNASIVYIDREAHVVFSGKLVDMLDEPELQAIIAHELSHVQLYTQLEGAVETTDRIVTALANHQAGTPAHYETARLFKLYTEIFCDRGACLVTGDYRPIISSLLKMSTGLKTVNADSYVRQAEEIFTHVADTKTAGVTHPENFIRARAIALWHAKGDAANPTIEQMIEGASDIDNLDLFRQAELSSCTRQLADLLLQPEWMRSPVMLQLYSSYFNVEWQPVVAAVEQLAEPISARYGRLNDYFSYVLYDFATADDALEDVPLGYCFHLAKQLGIDTAFLNVVKKEQKLTEKKATALRKQALSEFERQQQLQLI